MKLCTYTRFFIHTRTYVYMSMYICCMYPLLCEMKTIRKFINLMSIIKKWKIEYMAECGHRYEGKEKLNVYLYYL